MTSRGKSEAELTGIAEKPINVPKIMGGRRKCRGQDDDAQRKHTMTDSIQSRLAARNIELPEAAAPAANYLPYVISGPLLYISGQLPVENGALAVTGLLGRDVDVASGQRAAELCAINILSQARAALGGDLERIARVVKLNGFVASDPDFTEQHLVINGASNLLAEILGDAGKHARAAVGMACLPLNAAVEIDAVIEIR
jgi:enamine deaminase RidA (YjgF/YER057c/UK114 family)